MGFIICDQHPLFVTRTQVSDPWSMGPLVLLCSTLCVNSNFTIIPGDERAGCSTFLVFWVSCRFYCSLPLLLVP